MRIVIDIPKEFEEHFNSDKFEDSLARVASDIESFGFQLAGRYEQETITMLRNAIKNGTPLPEHHGDLVDRDAIEVLRIGNIKREYDKGFDAGVTCMVNRILDAPTIIEGSDSK